MDSQYKFPETVLQEILEKVGDIITDIDISELVDAVEGMANDISDIATDIDNMATDIGNIASDVSDIKTNVVTAEGNDF